MSKTGINQACAWVIIALAVLVGGLEASGASAPSRFTVILWVVIAVIGQVNILMWIAMYRNALKAARAGR